MHPEIWPPLVTPFDETGAIDFPALDRLIETFVGLGSDGFLVNGMSGEPQEMTEQERDAVLETYVRVVRGRVPLAAAVFPADQSDWVRVINRVHELGAQCAVIQTSHLAPETASDAEVDARLAEITKATTGDLGLYEAPMPYKRLLSDTALKAAVDSGRFVFFKDTSEDIDRIKRRIAIMRNTRFKFLNAQAATFRASVQAGGVGFCGIIGNVFPQEIRQAACDATSDMSDLLTVADSALGQNYPASAKLLLSETRDLSINSYSRRLGRGTTIAQCQGLFAADRLVQQMKARQNNMSQRQAS